MREKEIKWENERKREKMGFLEFSPKSYFLGSPPKLAENYDLTFENKVHRNMDKLKTTEVLFQQRVLLYSQWHCAPLLSMHLFSSLLQ